MATRPVPPAPHAAPRTHPFTRKSSSRRKGGAKRSSLPPVSISRPSVDLAGRSVALSIDIPPGFDAPLGTHHKMLGLWAAAQEKTVRRYTRGEARQRIEHLFNSAVLEILNPIEIVDLRVAVLQGDADLPPVLALICDSMGQMDLDWIEKSNALRNTMLEQVAPVGLQAAAYKALAESLNAAVPMIGFDDLMEELSAYYWDGATSDEDALMTMREWRGLEDDEIEAEQLPSAILARRPAWMLAENAYPLKLLPPGLAKRIRRLRAAHKALSDLPYTGSAWRYQSDLIPDYLPEYEDRATIPPMTIVPFDVFAREIDDIARTGMEYGFDDVIGLYQMHDAAAVDQWFASLRLGAELLLAAQDIITTHPFHP